MGQYCCWTWSIRINRRATRRVRQTNRWLPFIPWWWIFMVWGERDCQETKVIKKTQFRKVALSEIAESYIWYEKQREGLGEEFILCLEESIEKITKNPCLYPVVQKNIRRAVVRRFPYGIYYFVNENELIVIAVFHGKRNPKRWKNSV